MNSPESRAESNIYDQSIESLRRRNNLLGERLIEAGTRFRFVSNSFLEGLLILNMEAKATIWNQASKRMFGYDPEDILGKTVLEFLFPVDSNPDFYDEDFIGCAQNAIRKCDGRMMELLAFRKDGSSFPVEASFSSVNEGKDGSLIVIIRDITERKETERQIKESEEKYRTLVENVSDAVIISQDGKFIFANRQFALLLGYDPEEILMKDYREVYSPSGLEVLYERQSRRLRGEQVPDRYETMFLKKDGSEIFVQADIRIIEYKGAPATFAIIMDISKRKETEKDVLDYIKKIEQQYLELASVNKKLFDSEQKLIETNKTKDKLFSVVAHDLKNPFMSLLGLTSMLREDYAGMDKDELGEISINLNNSARHLYQLLENLLGWARLQTNRIEFNPEELMLSETVLDVIDLYKANAQAKEIRVEVDIAPDLSILTDRYMLHSVLRNLFSNAIKFSMKGGKVSFSSALENNSLIISVRDNGTGIRGDILKGLSETGSNQTTEGTFKEKGTGLGLVLVKEFIEKMGGTISMESRTGEGTCFKVALPIEK